MRVTSKGQVTIPKEFRDACGILPHMDLDFDIDGNKIIITRARKHSGGKAVGKKGKPSRGDLLVDSLKAAGKHWDKKWTTDRIMRLTRS